VPFQPPTLLCDNLSAVLLSHNPVLHARTKHIELDIYFVRERVVAKKMRIQHVPATAQIADTNKASLYICISGSKFQAQSSLLQPTLILWGSISTYM